MTSSSAANPVPSRLLSLDVVRGLTIALMIVVNTPGSWAAVYSPLLHAGWHGLTPTDLVFPSFLGVVGFSIALAYAKHRDTPSGRAAATRKILIRALKIFALGLFLNLWPDFEFGELRVAGVLQRIALVFAAGALLYLHLRTKALVGLTLAILLGYWALLSACPVPRDAVIDKALASGQVERAQGQQVPVSIALRDETSLQPNLEPGTNLAAWVDRKWLPGRMYEVTWDPEGWLSTLPSLATVLIGLLAGMMAQQISEPRARTGRLLLCAGVALALGYAWARLFPLNKNLWTSSFALVSAGWMLLAAGIAVWLVDHRGWKKPALPFLVFGTNPIAAYVLAGTLNAVSHRPWVGGKAPVEIFVQALGAGGVTPKLASLISALLFTVLIFVPVLVLYRRRIFLRL